MASVALVGSRSLPGSFAPLVRSVAASVLSSGRGVASGCCVGADSFAVSASLALGVGPSVFAAGAASGAGFCDLSCPLSALRAAGPGVRWLAGGPLSVPLGARLAGRTAALVEFVAASGGGAGLVCFCGRPLAGGSLLACRLAASAGLPVVLFLCGFRPTAPGALPSVLSGPGSWAAAAPRGLWSGAFRWVPAPGLF